MKTKKRVLVTGGAGFIGSHTCSLLRTKGYEVTIVDDLSRGREQSCKGFKLFRVDLKNKKDLSKVFKERHFDVVVHFAAYIVVNESVENPDMYFENNVVGTINLLNAMSEFGVKQLVFSSSAAVYGNPKKVPIDEDDPKVPTNPYGLTKLFTEQMLPWYERKYGFRSVCLRYFNACGASLSAKNGEAHRPEGHIIPLIMRVVFGRRKEFLLFGSDYPTKDGSCIRDYIHVLDLANAHLASLNYLMKGGESNYFNVGTGKGYSNWEVVNTVRKITGVDFKVKIEARRAGDPAELVANNKKILKTLEWKPRYSDLEMIIKTAYNWHRGYPISLED